VLISSVSSFDSGEFCIAGVLGRLGWWIWLLPGIVLRSSHGLKEKNTLRAIFTTAIDIVLVQLSSSDQVSRLILSPDIKAVCEGFLILGSTPAEREHRVNDTFETRPVSSDNLTEEVKVGAQGEKRC
jgi:hypothetical protein